MNYTTYIYIYSRSFIVHTVASRIKGSHKKIPRISVAYLYCFFFTIIFCVWNCIHWENLMSWMRRTHSSHCFVIVVNWYISVNILLYWYCFYWYCFGVSFAEIPVLVCRFSWFMVTILDVMFLLQGFLLQQFFLYILQQ